VLIGVYCIVCDVCVVPGGRFEIPVCRLVEDRIVVDVDSSMEFHCIASGTPEPQIEWSRPGGARLPSHAVIQNGYLRISRVRREDQGEYICIALNAAGQAEVTGTLIVREGELATLMCVFCTFYLIGLYRVVQKAGLPGFLYQK